MLSSLQPSRISFEFGIGVSDARFYTGHVQSMPKKQSVFAKSSCLGSSVALSRLCLVLAVTTLFLCVQWQQVVAKKLRRLVDCHWHRGNS
jgi:hypothetical protein